MDIAEANRPATKSHAAHAAAAMRAGTMVANPAACVPFIPLYNIRCMEQHGMYFCFLSTGLNLESRQTCWWTLSQTQFSNDKPCHLADVGFH